MVSPKTKFLEWDTTAGNNTDVGGIGILGTNAVNNFDDALRTIMAQLRAGIDGEVAYATKSSNYSSTADDNNAFHRFTATATVTLVAAATLGAGWHYTVSAVGAATVVTIDPNGLETIGGVTTLILRGGQTAFIICDGTNFQVEIRGTAYATQSGGYTAVIGDRNTVQRFTATATLALTAAATLGASWTLDVIADGGIVTIDPNGSETVNGFTTFAVPNGTTARIICDGSNFFVVMFPAMWKPVGQGLYTLSAASQLILTDLGGYRKLRITGQLTHSTAGGLTASVSTNNGSSYDTASNYLVQTINAGGTSVGAASSTATALVLAGGTAAFDGSTQYSFSTELEEFNQNVLSCGLTRDNAVISTIRGIRSSSITHNGTTARNALRIFPSAGTFTGQITVEGLKG
jgi:hypothetical protein